MPTMDLLNLHRPPAQRPWSYVKVAEVAIARVGSVRYRHSVGVNAAALPHQFWKRSVRCRHKRLSSSLRISHRTELTGQTSWAQGRSSLVKAVAAEVDRVRLLYLYPSDLSDELIDVILGTDVPYFDLSLQHVSKPLLRRMRRWGDGDRFLQRISDIRAAQPDATMRSNFIVGYPGETEDDHAALVDFVEEADLDWCGFFAFSREVGTCVRPRWPS